jgi:hypothetical protein
MRITISHNRSKAEIIESVDRSFNEMLQGVAGLPVRLVVEERSWQGSILSFSLTAKLGLLGTPIKGTVEVTDQDVTVDADLGLLNRLVPENTALVDGTRPRQMCSKMNRPPDLVSSINATHPRLLRS